MLLPSLCDSVGVLLYVAGMLLLCCCFWYAAFAAVAMLLLRVWYVVVMLHAALLLCCCAVVAFRWKFFRLPILQWLELGFLVNSFKFEIRLSFRGARFC